jgi:type IV pilus assembly protein PilV
MNAYLLRTPAKRHRGVSLIEVLVALLILSIGLLGVAGLQVVALRSNHGSFVRGQAVLLASDMADRMRANRLGVISAAGTDIGNYDSANVAGNFQAAADNTCTQVGVTAPNVCTVTQMAAHDRFEWDQILDDRLPAGTGQVCIDTSGAACDGLTGVYWIRVTWIEIVGGGPVNKRYVLRFQL